MYNEYRYNIEIRYLYNNEEVVLDAANIKSINIDYDYDNRNMPIMFLKANIDKNVLDDMIINSTKKTVTVIISKFINNSTIKMHENYIRDRFIYFLSKDLNPNKELDYQNDTKESKDIFKTVTIGLMKLESINDNKKMINTVFKNTSISNMICSQLEHMNLLMEPVKNNKSIPSFIVPPLNTISSFIEYINNNYNLYSTMYRLFYDYDKTYLVSSSGNPIPSKTESMSSVVMNVNNTTTDESKIQGIGIDYNNKVYMVNLDTNDISLFQDEVTDRSFNTIVGIGSDGKYKKVKINGESVDNTTENVLIERYTNQNVDMVDNIKSKIENNIITINVTKSELDSSVFTINKEYIIRNFDKLGHNNGKFLLSRKREIYIVNDGAFALSCLFTFRKILS